MIRNIAALLAALQAKEVEAIERTGISHAPTIGAQYEGLTASLLERMIPAELELQVVNGFVEGVDGLLSGQIDCMLVRGSGTPIPYVNDAYKWPIKNVLAVIEVKKTLFGRDLTDAHDQMQSVMGLFWTYLNSVTPEDDINIDGPRHIYGQILGEPPPVGKQFDSLPFDKEQLYRMLVEDHVAPVRIIIGYFGYSSESTLRDGFLNFLGALTGKPASGGSALPSLIVCGSNSIVKVNGQPFYTHPRNGEYLCYASSSVNPILWILNLILTKIANVCGVAPDWFARDLTIDRFAPLIWGKAVETANGKGWSYSEHALTAKDLESVPTITAEEWRPVPVSENEAILMGMIGNDGIERHQLLISMATIELSEQQVLGAVQGLIDKRLAGWDGDCLVFLTRRCATVFTPKGGMVAVDLEDERSMEWMTRDE